MRPFDPLLAQPTRLHIVALLFRNRQAAAADMARALGLTPGNLASHVARLEEEGYVTTERALVPAAALRRWWAGKGEVPAAAPAFQVRHRITPKGDAAFRAHAEALRDLLAEALAPQRSDALEPP